MTTKTLVRSDDKKYEKCNYQTTLIVDGDTAKCENIPYNMDAENMYDWVTQETVDYIFEEGKIDEKLITPFYLRFDLFDDKIRFSYDERWLLRKLKRWEKKQGAVYTDQLEFVQYELDSEELMSIEKGAALLKLRVHHETGEIMQKIIEGDATILKEMNERIHFYFPDNTSFIQYFKLIN